MGAGCRFFKFFFCVKNNFTIFFWFFFNKSIICFFFVKSISPIFPNIYHAADKYSCAGTNHGRLLHHVEARTKNRSPASIFLYPRTNLKMKCKKFVKYLCMQYVYISTLIKHYSFSKEKRSR